MNFKRGSFREEPEINLIPMIDVLLVILIFLMVTTTYAKFSGLEINLPTADTTDTVDQINEVNVALSASGEVLLNNVPVGARDIQSLTLALRKATADSKDPVIIISADAKTPHQSVIDVMQAAQNADLNHISFATQSTGH